MQEVKAVIDPGYSAFKFALAAQGNLLTWKEPTLVSLVPDFQSAMDGVEPDDSCLVEHQGKKYLVGSDADAGLRVFQEDSFEFLYKRVLTLFLKKLLKRLKPDEKLNTLALTVSPADFYRKEEILTTVKEVLPDVQVRLFPQGLGAWLLAGMPSDCVVVDAGYNTVDLLPFHDGKFQKEHCKSFKGAGVVSFLKQISYDDPHNLVKTLENGDRKIRETLVKHYPDYLASILQPYLSARAIFAGGGALFIPRGTRLPFKYAVVKDPVFANVKGVATLI